MRVNHVKKALKEGKVQLGCAFAQFRSPEVARILAKAGFHWTYLDTEHGNFDIESVQDICRAASEWNLCPIVRVADLQYALIARALDNGAMGIIFPRVESPELLARAISWMKFPPVGVRGFGLTPTHVEYVDATIPQIAAHMNDNIMVVLQIETELAVERRDELLSVPGIDAVMVGPVDLSVSLGVPGDFFHPKMVDAMEKVRDSCIRHGVAPGTQTRTLDLAKFWKERGLLFLGCGAETGMLMHGAKAIVTALS
ncbi:MAG: aldolase [Bryobacteraceae bacterium]|nr:aldolase [Bryobacteraceae bacterium]